MVIRYYSNNVERMSSSDSVSGHAHQRFRDEVHVINPFFGFRNPIKHVNLIVVSE